MSNNQMNKETGGPAFPSKKRVYREGYEFEPVDGMTLRQYAAIHAMQGILANRNCMPETQTHFDNIAEDALRVADTLLAVEARK